MLFRCDVPDHYALMRNNTVFSKALFFLSNILFPLTAGFTIYLLFQSDVPIVNAFSRFFGISLHSPQSLPVWMHTIVRNYLPDAFWAYALVFSMVFILGCSKLHCRLAFIISSFISLLTETAQLLALIPGTFDILDTLIEIIAAALALFIIIQFERIYK